MIQMREYNLKQRNKGREKIINQCFMGNSKIIIEFTKYIGFEENLHSLYLKNSNDTLYLYK